MSNADIRGRFVWHELTTTSPEGASAFYGKLVPWETQPTAMPSYSMWTAGSATVAGLAAREDDDPHWLVYIGSEDVDATVTTAQALGASVVTPPTDIPGDIGRFAVLDDPQGARFAVFTPGSAAPPPASSGAMGEFTWHELATSDAEEATDFYTDLFGWERGPAHDLGGSMGQYQLVERAGQQIGGIHKGRPGTEPRWLSYIRVEDADEAADHARRAGGTVVNGPMEVPGGSWIVMLEDPQGASIAVHEPAIEPAQAEEPEEEADEEEHKPAKAKAPRKPKAEAHRKARAVAAEQPKPPSASEELDELGDDEDEDEHEHHEEDEHELDEVDELDEEEPPKPARKPRAKPAGRVTTARKAPAKRAAMRRTTARKKSVAARSKTRARPVAVKKKAVAAKKKSRAKAPARAVARSRAPVRGRAAPARRAAAKKVVRGRRR